jgi:hypothetical protein
VVTTYRHPKSWGWRFAVSTPIWIFSGLGMIYVSLAVRSPISLFLIPLGLYGVLHVTAKLLLFASSISVTSEGIAAARYLRRTKRVRWGDMSTVERYRKFTFDSREMVRITDGRNGGSVVFTDAISDFPELLQVVMDRAPGARRTTVPLVLRAILG